MKNDRGGAVIWIVVVIVLICCFAGFRIGKLYFDHSTLENEVAVLGDNVLVSKSVDPEKTKNEINRLLSRYDVQLEPDDIQVEFNPAGDRVNIAFRYGRPADLIVTKYWVGFGVAVQREATKAVGIVQNVQDSIDSSNAAAARKYQDAVKNATGAPAPSVPTE